MEALKRKLRPMRTPPRESGKKRLDKDLSRRQGAGGHRRLYAEMLRLSDHLEMGDAGLEIFG